MTIAESPRVVVELTQPDSDTDWRVDANCNTGTSALTRVFFSDDLADIAAAKRICATCPMLEQCLAGAIERREKTGIWGGQLFRNGRVLLNKRRRGRPSKSPRPQDRLPEIEIPESLRASVRYAPKSVA